MEQHTSNIFQRRILKSCSYSIQGLRATFVHEEAFRVELLLAVVLLPLGLYLGVTAVEKVVLAGSIVLVLIIEILNSAVESVVDRLGTEHHELSGRAKDQGSAAVLLSILLVLLVWSVVLLS